MKIDNKKIDDKKIDNLKIDSMKIDSEKLDNKDGDSEKIDRGRQIEGDRQRKIDRERQIEKDRWRTIYRGRQIMDDIQRTIDRRRYIDSEMIINKIVTYLKYICGSFLNTFAIFISEKNIQIQLGFFLQYQCTKVCVSKNAVKTGFKVLKVIFPTMLVVHLMKL